MKDQFGLQGTPALVIGGASGIGRATAVLLGEVGASVAVADLNPDGAAAVADEITAAGGITTIAEIQELAQMKIHSALGMAVYTGRLDLGELAELNRRLAN